MAKRTIIIANLNQFSWRYRCVYHWYCVYIWTQ